MMRKSIQCIFIAAACLWGAANAGAQQAEQAEKKIALICNYYAAKSHANVIASKFFAGFPTDEGLIPPTVKIVSMYIDQPSPDQGSEFSKGRWDVGRRMAEKHDVKVYPTVAGALTLGGDTLAVDGVIYIGEHGDYPRSRLGVKMYPRLNILEQIFRVFDASDRVVPVFTDKHLAYSWLDSKWVYDRARELDVPFMAGSSLPFSWRDPMLEHPIDANIAEAVAVGYGSLDSYGFHVLEILQSMMERRKGGESGVASVQCLNGPEVYEAARQGKFSMELAEAAFATIESKKSDSMEESDKNPTAVLITYNDGTKGTILMAGRYIGEHWAYAAKVDDKTVACEFTLEHNTYAHFSYLGLNIEKMFLTGRPQAPVERTLLTSGILDEAVRSLADGGKVRQTPFLNIQYDAAGFDPILPKNPLPIGQSLGPWPPADYEYIVWQEKPSAKVGAK